MQRPDCLCELCKEQLTEDIGCTGIARCKNRRCANFQIPVKVKPR